MAIAVRIQRNNGERGMTWCEEPGYVYIDPMGSGVRCMDCRHERPVGSAPSLSRCAVGEGLGGAAGNWRSDYRHCASHQPKDVA